MCLHVSYVQGVCVYSLYLCICVVCVSTGLCESVLFVVLCIWMWGYKCVVCMWFAICKNVYTYICGMCMYIGIGVHVSGVLMCRCVIGNGWFVCVHWGMCKHVYMCSYTIVFCEHVDICVVIHVCVLVGVCVLYVMCVFSVCTCISMCISTLLIFGCLGTPASYPFSIYWLSFQRSSGQMFLVWLWWSQSYWPLHECLQRFISLDAMQTPHFTCSQAISGVEQPVPWRQSQNSALWTNLLIYYTCSCSVWQALGSRWTQCLASFPPPQLSEEEAWE